jgi:ATP-dependent DNA helicase RecG
MTEKELYNLIEQGEGENLELKSNFNNELIETLVVFANTSGGRVILGINDQNNLTGIKLNSESLQNRINEIKNKTSPSLIPDVSIINSGEKAIVVFSVQEYPIKPVATRGKYYKRVANSNHLMGPDEISNEHLRTINSSWDFYCDPNHGIDTISIKKVQKFIYGIEQQTLTKIELEPIVFLSKFEIIRDKQLTFGGFLLFVKDYCLISDVQVGRFKSETMIIDSISLNTDLFTEVDEILVFIKKHLMVEYIITGEPQRTERFDYPMDAIREIVINMIVHRDYHESSQSIIKIFDDRIEFFNPGKLYGNLTITDLLTGNYTSQTRNKLIAKAFKEAGLIERYGSGIRRIINICKDYGVKQPRFEEVFNGFKVTLFKEKTESGKKNNTDVIERVGGKVGEKVGGKVGEKVGERVGEKVGEIFSDNQQRIIKLILLNKRISARELSAELGISQRKVEENISKLKEKGKLKRMGAAKGGYWEVLQ